MARRITCFKYAKNAAGLSGIRLRTTLVKVAVVCAGFCRRDSISAPLFAPRTRLAIAIVLAAFLGDALNVIRLGHGFEISQKRWYDEVVYFSMANCPAFVHENLEQVIANMTPIGNSYGGAQESIGFDRKPSFYCAPKQIQAFSFLPDEVDSDEVFTTIGSARRYWSKAEFRMLDCDVWLNSEMISPENIKTVLRHEWGHCLGLDHEDNQLSIMASTLPSILSEELTINDIAGLNVLYDLCEDAIDSAGNHFMHKVPFDGEFYYGIMPANTVWPQAVHTVGLSAC